MSEPIDHYCLLCKQHIGRFVPLTDYERDVFNVIDLCHACYCTRYPHYCQPYTVRAPTGTATAGGEDGG